IFEALKRVGDPQSLMLVLPDFDYELKRELVQYVKSVRLMLEASRDFKFESPIRLDLALEKPYDEARRLDVLYALALEVSFMGLIDRDQLIAVRGTQGSNASAIDGDGTGSASFVVPLMVVNRDSLAPGFMDQLKSH